MELPITVFFITGKCHNLGVFKQRMGRSLLEWAVLDAFSPILEYCKSKNGHNRFRRAHDFVCSANVK